MAEFCSQCSIELFGKDEGDFKGLSSPNDSNRDLFVPVTCEGCGFIFVDHLGRCIGVSCLSDHQRPADLPKPPPDIPAPPAPMQTPPDPR